MSDRDILAAIGALEASLHELGYESSTLERVLPPLLGCLLNLRQGLKELNVGGWKVER